MNIGEASKLSGLTVKATRYYANIDLVKPRQDIQTGYRMYTEKDVLKLKFIPTMKYKNKLKYYFGVTLPFS